MPLDWSPLVDLLRRHERPLLMTHIRPDADGMGAQLALYDALVALGRKPRVAIASKLLPRYEFLDPQRRVIEDFKPATFTDRDCVVVLDTGTWNQLGDFGDWLKKSPLPRAVVDHHRTQDDLGGLQLVDITAEATGRLAYEIIRALGAPISPQAAHHLFMAIATDTGWFRHPNATPATFTLCGELVAAGANPTVLYEQLYEAATLARFKLTAVALERLAVRANGKIAFTEIALGDYEKTGAVPGDTEDLINYPRGVEGVDLALVFIEQPGGGTKVSFRSRAADVSKLAEQFGGGGHKLASGARVNRPLAEARETVLAAAIALLEQ
ncbi:bifunctional oligoribonuclease/PAP phosphatase NrnA [Gemmata sp. G18]|uniref:Bifunctional oligoribonuclease/PAP phosphatase NrnA n=1 Tax=Gemmata palustris TaxID=2822762 RepID=A0ABS5BYW0_9BACT|nr:bifunctional oligoribonuclease/PAP phosphatase NrnA [Gemmata palustris]MBP3958915.1 bifunctional oligoribonuclease/PAP phosphatase NrnA [Gemmata palustris]